MLARSPELNAYTAQSPLQFSSAISSRESMSRGLTRPEINEGASDDGVYIAPGVGGQTPPLWQLKAPMIPDNLFKFQIFRRLQLVQYQCE